MIRKLFLIFVCMWLLCGCASAETLEVGDGYTYSTVNAAYSAAVSGDTILIHPGTYNERLDIQNINNLTFLGVEYPTVTYTPPTGNNAPVFLIGTGTSNIKIKGLVIENYGAWPNYNGGIRAAGGYTSNLYVEDNIINTYKGDGIWFDGPGVNFNDDNKINCNNSLIFNNTVRTTDMGRGIYVRARAYNLTVSYNDVSVTDNFSALSTIPSGAYGINIDNPINFKVNNNIVRCCSYSLLKTGGINATVENNTAYGKAVHNCYEYGYQGGRFTNNTLIETNTTWMRECTSVTNALENFYAPGSWANNNIIIDNNTVINSTHSRVLGVGGHQRKVLVKDMVIDAPYHPGYKVLAYMLSGSGITCRTTEGLVFDNFSIINHTAYDATVYFQGVGTDLTPTSHTKGDMVDLIRDNITMYDVRIPNNPHPHDVRVCADASDTNISLHLVNSNLSVGYIASYGGSILSSVEWYWFTDVDVMDGGSPAGTSRLFVESNTTRIAYDEQIPYFNANYEDESQANHTWRMTERGGLETPMYIETLSNGKTGTRNEPVNCLILASATESLSTITSTGSITQKSVSYNITAFGGSFDSPYFYTTPSGTSDVITVNSVGTYEHLYGTKNGAVTGFQPTNNQYKTNSYERGNVDLTIPITEYDKTVIPMGVAM